MLVVSDTSPLNYLVVIELEEVLPKLFGRIIVPTAVADELRHPATPTIVRQWIASPPEWVEMISASIHEPSVATLGRGERDAISIAMSMEADLLLMDDRVARLSAEALQLTVVGTLGVIQAAAKANHCDLRDAIARLRQTSFRVHPEVLRKMLEESDK